MGFTSLSQGSPSRPEEQDLPCTGCPETAHLSAEPNLPLSTWQSWEMLPLTEVQSHFFWKHRLLLRRTGGTGVSRALLVEVRAHLPGLRVQEPQQQQIFHGVLLRITPKAFCITLFLKERAAW